MSHQWEWAILIWWECTMYWNHFLRADFWMFTSHNLQESEALLHINFLRRKDRVKVQFHMITNFWPFFSPGDRQKTAQNWKSMTFCIILAIQFMISLKFLTDFCHHVLLLFYSTECKAHFIPKCLKKQFYFQKRWRSA